MCPFLQKVFSGNWARLDCRIAVSNQFYDRLKTNKDVSIPILSRMVLLAQVRHTDKLLEVERAKVIFDTKFMFLCLGMLGVD